MNEPASIPPAALPVTEGQLQAAVIGAARSLGWRIAHFRPAATARGYRTPMQGHKGFPDLVLARAGVVFVWELKGWQGVKRPVLGQPEPEQLEWLAAIGAGVADCRVVYPADVDAAIVALRTGCWPS